MARVKPGKITVRDDLQKGRWGGLAERNGRRLRAIFYGGDEDYFDFCLIVESTDSSPLKTPVHFHLHDSFEDGMNVSVKKRHRESYVTLERWAYETFTLGVEVLDRDGEWIALELDLEAVAAIPDAYKPKRVTINDADDSQPLRQDKEEAVTSRLEAILDDRNPMIADMAEWRRNWSDAERTVCRVKCGSRAQGTGFLVGPNLLLTNYHVISPYVEMAGSYLTFEFDYRYDRAGPRAAILERKAVEKDWLLVFSPTAPSDELSMSQKLPTVHELDFALIQLTPISEEVASRGCLQVVPGTDMPVGSALIILQHPKGLPMTCSIETKSVISVNTNRTRVRYRNNTEDASSGSPIFSMDWQLVGLHHGGRPHFNRSRGFNQGIPIETIRPFIEKHLDGDR